MTHSRSSRRRGKGRFPPGSGNSPGLGEFTWECDSAQQLDLSEPQTRTLRWLQGPQLRGSGASPVSLKSSILQNSRSLCQNLHPKSSFRISVPCPAPLWTPHWVLAFVPMGFRAGVFRCFATPRFQVAPGQNQGEFHLHRWEEVGENPAQAQGLFPAGTPQSPPAPPGGKRRWKIPPLPQNHRGKLSAKMKGATEWEHWDLAPAGVAEGLLGCRMRNCPIPSRVHSFLSHQENSRSFSVFSKKLHLFPENSVFLWLVMEFEFLPN